MSHAISTSELEVALSSLAGWEAAEGVLSKVFTFASFRDAMAFMNRVSFEIEDMNHHPEWQNAFNKVAVRLTTHEAGGEITDKDIKLAQKMEDLYAFYGVSK